MFHLLSGGLLIAAILVSKGNGECYYRNGTEVINAYTPIDNSASNSMCCRFSGNSPDRADPKYPGLCVVLGDQPRLARESCTDKTWQAPECLKLCSGGLNPWGGYGGDTSLEDRDVYVTACNDGSFCCDLGLDADKCCNSGNGMFLVDGVAMENLPSSTPSPSNDTTMQSAAPDSMDSNDDDDGGLSRGAIAGIVSGSIAASSFLLGLWARFRTYRKKKSIQPENGSESVVIGKNGNQKTAEEVEANPLHELPTAAARPKNRPDLTSDQGDSLRK